MIPTPTPSGIQFGPTTSGKMYLCYSEHRGAGNTQNKSQWVIPEIEEYKLFCVADDSDWKDDQDNYWAVNDGNILGTQEERVAKFWDRSPWHGYPVLTSHRKPPKLLIDLWLAESHISRADAKRMKRGQI